MKELLFEFVKTNPVSTFWTIIAIGISIYNGYYKNQVYSYAGNKKYAYTSFSTLPLSIVLFVIGLVAFNIPYSTKMVDNEPFVYFLLLCVSLIEMKKKNHTGNTLY